MCGVRRADNPRAERVDAPARTVHGTLEAIRVGRWRFPVMELRLDGTVLARLGRPSWSSIVFGRGARVDLAGGGTWRVTSKTSGPVVCPIVIDSLGRRVAISGLGNATYGITGRDYGCVLVPAEAPRFGRANRWVIRSHEEEWATVTRRPWKVETVRPIHLGAALLALVLARDGVFGERALSLPAARWS